MNFSKKTFYNSIRHGLFGGSLSKTAVGNMEVILDYWLANHASRPAQQLAYVLATVRHEVGKNMQPVRETFASSDQAARRKLAGKRYGKPAGKFGHAYYGRGYVQLTWLKNYEFQEAKLGVPLVSDPDLALQTEVAIRILVEGMLDGDFNGRGHGLGHYVNENKQDYEEARRTVNIKDKASLIAGYARKFETAIVSAIAAPADTDDVDDLIIAMVDEDAVPASTEIEALVARIDSLTAAVAALTKREAERMDADDDTVVITTPVARPVPPAPDVVEAEIERNRMIESVLSALPAKTSFGKTIKSMKAQDIAALLTALERSGVIKPANGLTPVNGALGETVGKLLNGKKTVLGTIGLLATTVLPVVAGYVPGLAPIANIVRDTAPTIIPIASALAGWGVLGKIDKWFHKPVSSSFSNTP